MAMYANPFGRVRTRCDEMGIDICPVQGPPLDTGGWTTVFLYFWACQPDFVDNNGNAIGGGHFGLQAMDHGPLPRKSAINWGCYDSTGTGGSTFRSTKPTDSMFYDYGNPSTFGYPWEYGHWYRFRVFKSPKQNWLAAEINDHDQPAPWAGSNQRSDETAYRCTVQDVSAGGVPVPILDILVKNAASSKAIANGMCWTEPLDNGTGGIPNQEWPYSPIVRFRHPVFDGPKVDPQYEVSYYTGSPVPSHCDVILGASYVQMYGTSTLTRTNAAGTLLTCPSALWDAGDVGARVYPPTDTAPRSSSTPHPWF